MTTTEEMAVESDKVQESGADSNGGSVAADDALFDIEPSPEDDGADGSGDEGEVAASNGAAAPPAEETESDPEFTFHPKNGSDPITIPSVQAAIPAGKQRWFFWKLRKLRGLEQPIFWLEQAGVAEVQQEQIMLLPDQEWSRFYEEWMAGGTGAGAGE